MRLRPVKFLGLLVVIVILLEITLQISKHNSERSKIRMLQRKDRIRQLTTNNKNVQEIPRKVDKNNKRWLTIAIPTIERQKRNYFFTMIESLIQNTQINQLENMYVIVFLADLNNTKWKDDTEMILKRKYPYLFEIGTLKVIRAPIETYSGLDTSFKGINISYWRIKQNYDYAFMMRYCQNMSEYYLQMEDDVITVEGYIEAIVNHIKRQNGDNWMCLEFSKIGFIGKLYHTRDLSDLAQFLLLFRKDHPTDHNNVFFNEIKGQKQRLLRIPTIFQHIGYHSSLPNRIQVLKDKYFQENFIILVFTYIGIVCVVIIACMLLFWAFKKKIVIFNQTNFFRDLKNLV